MVDDPKKLNKSIDRLEKRIRNSDNLGLIFLRGVIRSIGTIIGLAVIALLVVYLVSRFDEGSSIGKFLNLIANLTTKN